MDIEQYKNKPYHGDCLDFMRSVGDNYFDLVITDPPYGLGNRLVGGGQNNKKRSVVASNLMRDSEWVDELPDPEIFEEIFRISKNQIIWGGNYFDLPTTRGFICWDKDQHMPSMSACEYGWTSYDKPAKLYKCRSLDLNRKHPTQKPIALMNFCLHYANATKDMKIFDPFLGSGTTALSCKSMGLDWWGCELQQEYINVIERRLTETQIDLFGI